MNRSFLASLVMLAVSMDAHSDEFNDRIDAIFNNLIAEDEPGCSVGVIEAGQLVHQAGYGLANVELQVPMTEHNVHDLASVSKQFTAMAVHLLADEGKIKLDEDIRTYLPDLRDYGEKVTVNAMLGHVSGMANSSYSDYEYFTTQPGHEELALTSAVGGPFRFENEDYLSINDFYGYVQNIPLRYAPNERYHYSNIAYFLLAMLVEEVSDQSLADYADRNIFQPLGMDNTVFVDNQLAIIENRVSGYDRLGRRYISHGSNIYWVGDRGLHTNVGDLLKWDQHFYEPQLGSDPEALIQAFNQPNSSFKSYGRLYANGQEVTERHGETVYFHSGGDAGTSTFYERYPESEFSTIVLCNDASRNTVEYAKSIAQLYFYPSH